MTIPLDAVGQAATNAASELERVFSRDTGRMLSDCGCYDKTGTVCDTCAREELNRDRVAAMRSTPDPVLELHDAAETILAARLRQRVANRIAESREKELIPPKAPAIDLIRGVARELELAGQALEEAARALLNVTGQGGKAKAAHLAGQRAKDAAEGLTGG